MKGENMNIFYNHGGKEHLIKMVWRLFVGEPDGLETRHAILVFILLVLAILSLVLISFSPHFVWVYIFFVALFIVNIVWFQIARKKRDEKN